jgi:hypothetical protein
MCVVDVVRVCVSFEVDGPAGYGFAYGLGYECVWQGPLAYRYVWTRGECCVGWVSVRNLVRENIREVITDRVVACFNFAEVGVLALASRCIVLMYRVATCHHST